MRVCLNVYLLALLLDAKRVQHVHVQSGIVPIKVGVPVVGDVTVAVWFGSYNLGQRLHSRPALAFTFHTAFAEPGSMRITVDQLDLADSALIPPEVATNFFIDVILTEAAEVCTHVARCGQQGSALASASCSLVRPAFVRHVGTLCCLRICSGA